MPKKRVIKSDDDTVLWQRVTTEVTPLKSTIELAEFAAIFGRPDHLAPPVAKPSGRPQKTPVKPMRTQIAATSSAPAKKANPIDLRHGERAGIDGRTQRRLFRGDVPVDRRLDLHGLTAARAESRLVQFIETAARDGCRCVLVITGKGEGILRGYVPDWLKRQPLSLHILALAEARPNDGGSGALYVLLRRKRSR
ncbi:Smr/MutS family protein [Candidatus Puniceispirillum sp.]|nr:Smr/MutS family protein [Alphaproteobacteria bacterium]MDC1293706.1 Smr/MutS family protein [Candidatus Puniceispirillum sp.]